MRAVRLDRGRYRAQVERVRRRFEQASSRLRGMLKDEVREAGRITAGYLARLTFPNRFGVVLLKKAMAGDLRSAYATPGVVYGSLEQLHGAGPAKAFYAAYMARDYTRARQVMAAVGHAWAGVPMGALDPALHDPARNSKGRITLARPLQIVPPEDLKKYIVEAQKRMGKTASGWAACALILGSELGIPRWKRSATHGGGGGAVDVISTDTRQVVVLVNLRPLARRHISPGQVNRAVKMGRQALAYALRRGRVR